MSSSPLPSWTPGFQSLPSRLAILLSFYAVILLALPFWLKTTTIQRLALPRHDVVAWESQLPCPIRIPQSLIVRLPHGTIKRTEDEDVAQGIQRGLRAAGDGVVVAQQRDRIIDDNESESHDGQRQDSRSDADKGAPPLHHAACIDWNVSVKSTAETRVVEGLYYDIEYVAQIDAESKATYTLNGRSFQLPLPSLLGQSESMGSQQIASILAPSLADVFQLPYTSLFFPSDSSVPTLSESSLVDESLLKSIEESQEDRRQIAYTRNLRLVFSLINEDISAASPAIANGKQRKGLAGVRGWTGAEVEKLFRMRFGPLLSALHGTHTFQQELQTTWFAPLQFQPRLLEVHKEKDIAGEAEEKAEAAGGGSLHRASKEALDRDGENKTTEAEVSPLGESQENLAGRAQKSPLGEPLESQEEEEVNRLEELAPAAESLPDRIHLIDWEDIKVFVNSGEWSLSSGAASSPLSTVNVSSAGSKELDELSVQNEKTLHFVLYVPKPSHRPLRVAGNEEATVVSDAKGWLIPQWGGVALYNLGYEEAEAGSHGVVTERGGVVDSLTAREMDAAFATFEKQLVKLLGLRQMEVAGITSELSLALRLDALTRRRVVRASRESVKTLGSIVRLVDKIENLGVGASVRDDVSRSLALLEEANDLMRNNTTFDGHSTLSDTVVALHPLQSLLDLAHSSELLSSRAFFNPNMLGQLYFPDEHKYAVYTPLFGPLAVPLLVAGLRLIKERTQARAAARLAKEK